MKVKVNGRRKKEKENGKINETIMNSDLQGHLAYMPGNIAKASIVHIAPSDLMTSIVQLVTSFGSCPTSPYAKFLL